jgi:hypothetical protein
MAGQSSPQMTASSFPAQGRQMFDGPMVPVTVTFAPHRQVRVCVTGLMSYITRFLLLVRLAAKAVNPPTVLSRRLQRARPRGAARGAAVFPAERPGELGLDAGQGERLGAGPEYLADLEPVYGQAGRAAAVAACIQPFGHDCLLCVNPGLLSSLY